MIASVSAKPSHWIDVISSRISGWRVTDSITLPKMKPTPMPGPIVPRPAPTPRAIALPAFVGSLPCATCRSVCGSMWRSGVRSTCGSLLMGWWSVRGSMAALGRRRAEVDGGQGGEDEGLQRRDQADLEEVEGHGHRPGDHAQDHRAEDRQVEQHHEAAAHEED